MKKDDDIYGPTTAYQSMKREPSRGIFKQNSPSGETIWKRDEVGQQAFIRWDLEQTASRLFGLGSPKNFMMLLELLGPTCTAHHALLYFHDWKLSRRCGARRRYRRHCIERLEEHSQAIHAYNAFLRILRRLRSITSMQCSCRSVTKSTFWFFWAEVTRESRYLIRGLLGVLYFYCNWSFSSLLASSYVLCSSSAYAANMLFPHPARI